MPAVNLIRSFFMTTRVAPMLQMYMNAASRVPQCQFQQHSTMWGAGCAKWKVNVRRLRRGYMQCTLDTKHDLETRKQIS